ncbi:MAG: AAA family ATPase [Bdellovibrionales bacterium]|nr:AAA family ATPase [Bdellovibrionales bacterium]
MEKILGCECPYCSVYWIDDTQITKVVFTKKSPKSVLILGPRQTGKSTLIESLSPELTINLNDESTFLDFQSNPAQLNEVLEAQKPRTVFIDEIQRHPSLLNTIQVILDTQKKRAPKFYLTGSSARKLKRGQANLLPGRIFAYQMGGLSAAELDYKLNVKKSLKFGTLPEPYLHANEAFITKHLATYAGTYLKEEIMAEALTRNLDGFSRFLHSAAKSAGLILDFSKLSKQAKIERKLCSRFYEIPKKSS